MRFWSTSITAVVASILALSAHATIIFTPGNNPQPNEENILFNGAGTISGPALTVTGLSQTSNCLASFSAGEDLITPSSGQARVEAVDGGFTSLSIGLGCTVTDIIFAINPTTPGAQGSATVTLGSNNFTYTFGPGNTFLTIVATGGETFSGLSITGSIDIHDIRQVRISGSSLLPVPEPGTLALIGIGMLGLSFMRSRKS